MQKTVSEKLFCAATVLFAFCFTVLTALLLCNAQQQRYDAVPLVLMTAAAVVGAGAVYFLCKRRERALERYYVQILCAVLAFFAVVQIVAGLALRFTPAWDLDAIYSGAIQWAESGSFAKYEEYYQYFPNNLGGMTLLYLFFRPAHLLGVTDYFAVAVVLNTVLLTGSALFASLAARIHFGSSGAVFVLFLFAACLPFYFVGAVFYTDALSMIFPVLFYYLYLQLSRTESGWKASCLAAGMGLTLAAGITVKFTVVIMAIAVCVDAAIVRQRWRLLLLLAGAALLAAAAYKLFHLWIYSTQLDPVKAAQMNTPISHWIMMGLKGNGGYNGEDYVFTRSFSDPVERDAAIWQEIRNRIAALGLSGLLQLWRAKELVCFGDGTFALSSFLDDTPLTQNFLRQIVMEDGGFYPVYRHLCEAGFLSVLLLALIAAYGDIRKRGAVKILAPRLAALGLFLFFLIWETNGRLVLNFLPVLFLAAVPGARAVMLWFDACGKLLENRKNKTQKKHRYKYKSAPKPKRFGALVF